jgi:hypothetical protein
MSTLIGKSKQRVTLEAKVIRADGRVEDLGVIASSGGSLWTRLADRLRRRGRIEASK